mmetsp:Transcript_24168/g.77589  ORF Transcript_24168/g.77589 Transcript_24168/m.77589 type:complete len:369 (-) Transcript_24168:641-1747(-)
MPPADMHLACGDLSVLCWSLPVPVSRAVASSSRLVALDHHRCTRLQVRDVRERPVRQMLGGICVLFHTASRQQARMLVLGAELRARSRPGPSDPLADRGWRRRLEINIGNAINRDLKHEQTKGDALGEGEEEERRAGHLDRHVVADEPAEQRGGQQRADDARDGVHAADGALQLALLLGRRVLGQQAAHGRVRGDAHSGKHQDDVQHPRVGRQPEEEERKDGAQDGHRARVEVTLPLPPLHLVRVRLHLLLRQRALVRQHRVWRRQLGDHDAQQDAVGQHRHQTHHAQEDAQLRGRPIELVLGVQRPHHVQVLGQQQEEHDACHVQDEPRAQQHVEHGQRVDARQRELGALLWCQRLCQHHQHDRNPH